MAKQTAIIPQREADLITVCKDVREMMAKNPNIKLEWMTTAHFAALLVAFESSFNELFNLRGERGGVTSSLRLLRTEAGKSSQHLKNYAAELFTKKEASSHYLEFGIVKENGKFAFPIDHDKLLASIGQALKGIDKHNLNDRKFGTDYWTDLQSRFTGALQRSRTIDGQIQNLINTKKESRAQICKVLNALIALLKAQKPDTYKDELRMWGFQKEKY